MISAMQSIDLQNFMKNLKSAVLSRQKVITGQSPARPDSVRPGVGPGVFKPLNHCLLILTLLSSDKVRLGAPLSQLLPLATGGFNGS
jgi:hypothetical protein